MKINRRVIYWVAAFGLVVITIWFGYVHKSAESSADEKIVPVEVEVVTTGSIEETMELTGWIKANAIVEVRSKVSGRIESLQPVLDNRQVLTVEEGLAVQKGQRLAVIDHDVYLAELAAARANVDASEVELADAEREKKRIVALYEGGSATEQSRDKALTAAELAKARLTLARANLELSEIGLRESTISSPIDGIVTAKHLEEGNLIKTGDRIVTVADMKTVKVIVAIAEKYGEQITVGTPERIRVDAFGGRVFSAKVYSIYPALDEQTHTIQAEIRLENDELLLNPGMFARVTLITKRRDDVVGIPRDVVLGGRIDDKPYVYVVDSRLGGDDIKKSGADDPAKAETIAHKRFVKLGIIQADKVGITDGLEAGETLVVNGMHYLADGIGVEVVRIEDIK